MLRFHLAPRGQRSVAQGVPYAGVRRGAAVVEFAVVAMFFGFAITGMIELGRGLMIKAVLTDSAREGANTGIRSNKTYTDIWNAVDKVLSANSVPATLTNGKATLTVTVATWNSTTQTYGTDTVATSSTFAPNQNDKISVKVAVNASDVSWLFLSYTGGKVESEVVTMMKQ
jgi:Flp pilus assembly protein TadG